MRSGLLAMALAVAVPSAAADEPVATDETAARIVALDASIVLHKRDKDDAGLVKDAEGIVVLHAAPTTNAEQKERLNALVGKVLAGTTSESVEKAVLDAMGDIGDEANWRHARPYVRQPNPKVVPPLLLEGIECAGRLRAPGAIELLIKIVEDSKVYPPAASAMKALGGFAAVKGKRARILEAMISTVRRSIPSGNARKKGPGENADPQASGYTSGRGNSDASRWAALAPAMVEAANRLTGKTAGTPEDWFELYDRHKGSLDALFEG